MNNFTTKCFFTNGASEGGHSSFASALSALNINIMRYEETCLLTRVEVWQRINNVNVLLVVYDIAGVNELPARHMRHAV